MPSATPRRKTISASRDLLQSRILAWTAGTILGGLTLQALLFAGGRGGELRVLFIKALTLSLLFAFTVWRMRAATAPAALCGGMVCLLVTFFTGSAAVNPLHSGLAPLIALFILTFAATRAGRPRKVRLGLAECRRGRRASQVLANLGAAGLVCSLGGTAAIAGAGTLLGHVIFAPYAVPVLLVAVLAEATADTVSSEIGQAFGGTPVLLTSLRRVPPGTDGAVSLRGTLAGIAAATVVAAVSPWALGLSVGSLLIALAAGISGLFFDSLLGATVEKKGWLGNDLVNFASTLFAAAVAFALILLRSLGRG